MNIDKSKILDNICYTELVYERINKKLKTNNSKLEIEKKLLEILKQTSKEKEPPEYKKEEIKERIFMQRILKTI